MTLGRLAPLCTALVLFSACSGELGDTGEGSNGDSEQSSNGKSGEGNDLANGEPTGDPSGDGEGRAGDNSSGAGVGRTPDDPTAAGADDPSAEGAAADSGEGASGADPTVAVGDFSGACEQGVRRAISRESIRLNDWQFERAITPLFPFAVTLDPVLDSTTIGSGLFSTYPGANEVLANHARDLIALSENLAMQAVDHLDQMLPCEPGNGSEVACAEEFVRGFGAKAFRRPLGDTEVEHFMDLFDGVQSGSDGLDFDLGIGALVQAVLLSPETLYLIERGQPTAEAGVLRLTNHEIASRLSFLLWNSPPDEQLHSRAEAGELQDISTLAEEAERLFDDERSHEAIQGFVAEWFGVAGQLFVDHAPEPLAQSWNEEVGRYVDHVVYGGGAIGDLLNGAEGFVNQPLAAHYGISPNPSGGQNDWQLVTLPDERRGGLLTMAQFAAATSHNNETSIIHRGKAIREHILCGQLGAPDPSFLQVDFMLPEDATARDRMDARLSQPTCAGCHTLMDPIGLGMDDMDQNGLFRTQYDNGQVVDSAGEIVASTLEGEFNGVLELAHMLADSEQFEQCAADHWLRYASGRANVGADRSCLVQEMAELASSGGGTIKELLLAVIRSDAFSYRLEDDQ
jgi:hypothetical protein